MTNLRKYRKICIKTRSQESNETFSDSDPISLFLPYQIEWLLNAPQAPISVWEKSRRIGASWVGACEAVMTASREIKPKDSYYISYDKEMTMQFVRDAAWFAKIFNQGIEILGDDRIIQDVDKDILVYRIRFANGKQIATLSSSPRSLRSKQGNVIIDEAAFVDDLGAILKAAIALTIWGGQVKILSTHNGYDNPFNQYIIENKENPNVYIQRTSFMDAIDQGLFERLCLMSGEIANQSNKDAFIKKIYDTYKDNAQEELDVIPKSESDDSVFKKAWFTITDELPKAFDVLIRAWDTASTDKDDSCYTVGTLLGQKDEKLYILEWDYIKANAAETEEFIINIAKEDGYYIPIFIELEGGSQALMWLENSIKNQLPRHEVTGKRPQGSKLMRAVPIARFARNDTIYVKDAHWTQDFIKTIVQFTGIKKKVPLVNDTVDSLSLAFDCVRDYDHLRDLL